ncbi:retrovirus-related pol polyprotein from transposon TNT 1-94 [Tanacetum coccineum]
MPPTPDLSFTGLDKFVNEPVVENSKAMSSEEEPKVVRKCNDAPSIKEWVSDDKEEDVSQPQIKKKIVRPSIVKKEFVKSKQQEKTARKTVEQFEQHRQNTHSPRDNQRNWNNMMAIHKWIYKNQEVIDSGCTRHMTGNMSYLTDYEEIDGGYVTFGGNPKGGKITGKCTIKTVPRKNNMYSVDLKNIVPKGGLTYLFAKATSDESKLWHRRLCHLNFKTMNKLVKGNLVRGLPSKVFENDQTCIACQKGKHHRASSTKDETSGILKSFITGIENLVDHKVTVIRCDNGNEFKNKEMNQFCEKKGILRQFSIARTPQQNGVTERRNRTLIEAARTMLADSKTPTLSFMRPFGCLVTILNTIDHLGKFNGKADEGFFVGYSLNSKAFGVFNSRTMIVEENLHIRFSKSTPNVVGSGPDWLFDIDALTRTMNYEPIVASTQSNGFAGTKASDNADPKSSHDMIPKLQVIWKEVDENPEKDSECITKVLRNKKDERGIVIRKKARLIAQGYTQEEWIDYDKVFAPVARIKAIRLFLAYASFKDFVVYQMDVKSDFLYGKIEEEVYVCQPLGFEDPDFPDRVYKVEKALYRLHQAPKAWYETLSTYLLDNGFQRGKIDKTLFIKRHKGDILLMSSMGELTFFLGLQVKQKKDGIFISQDKYVAKILKKFGFTEVKTASTPMETQKPLLKDEDGKEVDVHMYRSMIGSLMYLTSSRPDIMFAVCACARYQVNPKVSHLHAVKRIFRYLKGQPKLGLWYPKDSPFDLVAYTDSDYAGASLDRKSTIGGYQFLGCRLVSWKCKNRQWLQIPQQKLIILNTVRKSKKSVRLMMRKLFGMELKLILFWSIVMAKTINGEEQLHALVDGKKIIITESSVRRDLQLADEEGVDCLPNSTIFEQTSLCLSPKTTARNEFSSTMASTIIA